MGTTETDAVVAQADLDREQRDCLADIYIEAAAHGGERLACSRHGTNCGHEHPPALDASRTLRVTGEGNAEHGDIDDCPWDCGDEEEAQP